MFTDPTTLVSPPGLILKVIFTVHFEDNVNCDHDFLCQRVLQISWFLGLLRLPLVFQLFCRKCHELLLLSWVLLLWSGVESDLHSLSCRNILSCFFCWTFLMHSGSCRCSCFFSCLSSSWLMTKVWVDN